MRIASSLAVALVLGACATPAILTNRQMEFVRVHPELGDEGRQALVDRVIAPGQTLERVMVAWDGVRFEVASHEPGGAVQSWQASVPLGGRSVKVRTAHGLEEIESGRVVLTFKNLQLFSWVRLE